MKVYVVERFIPSRCPSCSCHFSSPATFMFWWGGQGQNMTDAMRNQFASFPDLFPSSSVSSYKNPFDADFIACSSCKNITLRLVYGKTQVLSRDDADALLSHGFTCVTEGEAVGTMARTYSQLSFLGEADAERLSKLLADSSGEEADHTLVEGPLAEFFRQKHSEKALQNAEAIIRTFFSSYWFSLDPKTRERLTQAEYLRQHFIYQSECGHTLNFSPSVILYSSALEIELLSKVFHSFQIYSKGVF